MQKQLIRFLAGLVAVYIFFALILLCLKCVFAYWNWPALRAAGYPLVALAFWNGLRFEAATLAYLLAPALLLFFAAGATGHRWMRSILLGYLGFLALLVPLICLTDVQYFEASGKHLTYEATAYLNLSGMPILTGAFQLHPLITSLSLLACAGFVALSVFILGRVLRASLPADGTRLSLVTLSTFPILVVVFFILMRGGTQRRPLSDGHACISANPFINALCLDPIYSVLRSTVSASKQECVYYDVDSNIRTTRQILHLDDQGPLNKDYPLLRTSTGTPQGNRKNVVIFVLENWTAKELGMWGGAPNMTPFFDQLSTQGALFDHFYATGVRTAEGMFSILCSFPNQPHVPIMNRPNKFHVRWRPLSEILDEAGYNTLFIHGRDLDFDHMKYFLKSIHFRHAIDRDSFPPSTRPGRGSWPGFDDDEVMRRANQEFARQTDRPFLGAIYTMNTHEPFMTPEDFPLLLPPTSPSNKFLNSLHYADHSLETFFNLARKEAYFTNTVFVFSADHARMYDAVNFGNQHWIPMLIYSPGYVPPKLHHTVGSQLDLLPTILGLLQLQTPHASWGQDLLAVPEENGFAVSVSGNEMRWHDRRYVLNDSLTEKSPLLFDLATDPTCKTNVWSESPAVGNDLQRKLRAYLSLSQTLMYEDRVFPRAKTDKIGPRAQAAARDNPGR